MSTFKGIIEKGLNLMKLYSNILKIPTYVCNKEWRINMKKKEREKNKIYLKIKNEHISNVVTVNTSNDILLSFIGKSMKFRIKHIKKINI